MDLKITGTVQQVLDEVSGESRNGAWRKQEFILETEGQYPKPVCIVMQRTAVPILHPPQANRCADSSRSRSSFSRRARSVHPSDSPLRR